jgi:CheY-like chemotaxis protein
MSSHQTKFILVGEDDKDDQELLAEIFTSIDDSYRLMFVDTGTEAMSLLHKLNDDQKPCLILLDYNMPQANGADILKEINTLGIYGDIPKIIWSTSGSDNYKKVCLELGATDYLIKPSNVKDLEKAVRYMLSFCEIQL